MKKSSFFGSFYKLHSSSSKDETEPKSREKQKPSDVMRKKSKHSMSSASNGSVRQSDAYSRSSVEVDVEDDEDDDDRPTRRFTFSAAQRDVTRETTPTRPTSATSPTIKSKSRKSSKRKTGAISALLFQDAQVFGAVSLPNLANAMTTPTPSPPPNAVEDEAKTSRRRRKAAIKLDAYRHRMFSHTDQCDDESTPSISGASFDDDCESVTSSNVHVSTLSPVILRMRRDAITSLSFSSNSSLSSTGSAPVTCDISDMLAPSSSLKDIRCRVSTGRRTHLSVAERDERVRSLGSEASGVTSQQTSSSVGYDQPVVSPAFTQSRGLDSDYRQRLLTAPPALMRPYRRAFRFKSGQRHATSDAHVSPHEDVTSAPSVGRLLRVRGCDGCSFRSFASAASVREKDAHVLSV